MKGSPRPEWANRGTEPDPRASLANERTYLAWLRTGLGTIAAAAAVIHFSDGRSAWLGVAIGLLLAGAGIAITATAYARWAETERRMRAGQPLTFSPLMRLLPIAFTLVGLLAVVLAVYSR